MNARLSLLVLLLPAMAIECFLVTAPSSSVVHRSHRIVVTPVPDAPDRSTTTTARPVASRETVSTDGTAETTQNEESLTDVDARVLESMLRDKRLDLETEDDVRKLLERATTTTTTRPPRPDDDDDESSSRDSDFSSTLFQTLSDTTLWRKVSAQASDVLESVGLWVSNKVEQDVKVLAALGLFAWDRAVRDVSRALPAAGGSGRDGAPWPTRVFALTNTSTAVVGGVNDNPNNDNDNSNTNNHHNTNNNNHNALPRRRAQDELQSVSREVRGILSGDQTKATGRGLRTAAPAGSVNSSERQRRAYRQTKKITQQQQPDVTKVAGSVVDTAWELRREWTAETNRPGYKTKPLRTALEAGVASLATGTALRAAQSQARLAAAERQAGRGPEAPSGPDDTPVLPKPRPGASSTAQDPVRKDLTEERTRVHTQLKRCIDNPSATWLKPLVVDPLRTVDLFSGDGLQNVIAKMILLDTALDDTPPAQTNAEAWEQLRRLHTAMETICTTAAMDVEDSVGIELRIELFGMMRMMDGGADVPLILRLDDEDACEDEAVDDTSHSFFVSDNDQTDSTIPENRYDAAPDDQSTRHGTEDDFGDAGASMDEPLPFETAEQPRRVAYPTSTEDAAATVFTPDLVDSIPDAIVDVIPELVTSSSSSSNNNNSNTNGRPSVGSNDDPTATVLVEEGTDAMGVGLVAELVTDDDYDTAVGMKSHPKVAVQVSDDEFESSKDDSLWKTALLRSLDVTVFVVEKVVVVGLPGTIQVTQTATARFAEVNRDGRGSRGWKSVGNLASTKGRY